MKPNNDLQVISLFVKNKNRVTILQQKYEKYQQFAELNAIIFLTLQQIVFRTL